MKSLITFLFCLICLQLFACCNKPNDMTGNPNNVLNKDSMKLKIIIGTTAFTATLYNNPTVTAFKTRLPMTVNMRDLNANEKYFDMSDNLPANASNPGTIQAGDLMLYGSNTLVVFYRSFSTSYSYTPIGRIDDIAGLTSALGSGNVTVTFAFQ